jgi:hypothetical protein
MLIFCYLDVRTGITLSPAQMPDYLIFTCVSIPTVKSIKKNKTAQSGETGNLEIVSGYVMKASPGPKIECRSE